MTKKIGSKLIRRANRLAQSKGMVVQSLVNDGQYIWVHMRRKRNSPYGGTENFLTFKLNEKDCKEVKWW